MIDEKSKVILFAYLVAGVFLAILFSVTFTVLHFLY